MTALLRRLLVAALAPAVLSIPGAAHAAAPVLEGESMTVLSGRAVSYWDVAASGGPPPS